MHKLQHMICYKCGRPARVVNNTGYCLKHGLIVSPEPIVPNTFIFCYKNGKLFTAYRDKSLGLTIDRVGLKMAGISEEEVGILTTDVTLKRVANLGFKVEEMRGGFSWLRRFNEITLGQDFPYRVRAALFLSCVIRDDTIRDDTKDALIKIRCPDCDHFIDSAETIKSRLREGATESELSENRECAFCGHHM